MTDTDQNDEQAIERIVSAWMRLHPEADPKLLRAIRNVVVLLMRKGGAGKTTVLLLLCDALRRMGLNVLALDLDSQGSASVGFGHKVRTIVTGQKLGRDILEPDVLTICEVLLSGMPGVAEQAIQLIDWVADMLKDEPFSRGGPLFPGKMGQIGLISCYKAMESLQGEWRSTQDKERLRTTLLQAAEEGDLPPNVRWDVVLVDTPPVGSAETHVIAALASHWAQLIVEPQKFGGEAVPDTVEMVDEIRSEYHHEDLDLIGYVVNDFATQKRRTQENVLNDLEAGRTGDTPELFRAVEAPARIPTLQIIQDSQDLEAPLSYFLTRTKREREAAARVCQAAEAVALTILRRMNHPEVEAIENAWIQAWPEDIREPFVRKLAA